MAATKSGTKLAQKKIKLIDEISLLIDECRQQFAFAANAGMTFLYWKIGQRIKIEILKSARADYGKKIVVSLARQLLTQYGKSFEEKNLRRMLQFAEVFPDQKIVVSAIRQLSWTHFALRIANEF